MARIIRLMALAAILLFLKVSISSARVQPRVFGGIADTARFVVSLQEVTSSGYKYICPGTIINSNWVLTVAYYLSSSSLMDNLEIVAGSILVNGGSITAQTRTISYYVVNDDIGLLKTATAFVWSLFVRPASLPVAGAIPTGLASLIGWCSNSTTLQMASAVPIISLETCQRAILESDSLVNVQVTDVCTYEPLPWEVHICACDYGSPLMQGDTVIGMVSGGNVPCGQSNSPSVYVRVSEFILWIVSNQVVPS